MSNRIILILLALTTNLSFAQSWFAIDPTSISDTPDLSDVFFVSDDEGWMSVSNEAIILHTTDGGQTFEIQTTQYPTEAIYMIDENEGYAGGANGRVYRTIDGGENWIAIGSIGVTLTDIDFATTTQGYCCGDHGAVFSITPQGVENLNSGLASNLNGISASSVNNVWICGGGNIVYYNGTTFDFQSGPAGTYNSISFIDDNEGWVNGDSGLLGHTVDGGTTWKSQISLCSGALYDTFFLDTENGWAVGYDGTILHTTNGGDDWAIVGTGLTTVRLRGISFTTPTNGYVVGNGKTLIKYGLPLATKDEQVKPTNFTLEQNYPNPFNPITTIHYSLYQKTQINITIYDIIGKVINELLSLNQPTGTYSIQWNGTDQQGNQVPAGIYFYQLETNDFVQTKKMVLVK